MKVPPMTLGECPPGLFMFGGTLGFKSEYKTESQARPGFWQSDAYVVESGEYFWGGVSDPRERERLEVTPIEDDERYAAGFAAALATPVIEAARKLLYVSHNSRQLTHARAELEEALFDYDRAATSALADRFYHKHNNSLADSARREGE